MREVAPPRATQQLKDVLSAQRPQVKIVAPAADAILPAGPWTLQVSVAEWPLAGTAPGALGPHLVVQRDQEAPIRIGAASADLSGEAAAAPRTIEIPMEPLTPGSHRISVYAAFPWGEAVKVPGASTQIQLHRAAANPLGVPQPASAQLIPAIPFDLIQAEPVLIDWLLFDAPLQHLRDGDDSWRLRITLNGDSFLVDRQTPIWLKGLGSGESAVQLELLDGRGNALNPPFNSSVTAVTITPGAPSRWPSAPLSDAELKRALMGGAAARPVGQQEGALLDSQEEEELALPSDPGAGTNTNNTTNTNSTDEVADALEPAPASVAPPTATGPLSGNDSSAGDLTGGKPGADNPAGGKPTVEDSGPLHEREPTRESERKPETGTETGPKIAPASGPEVQPARGNGIAPGTAAKAGGDSDEGRSAGSPIEAGESASIGRARFGA
ncbi:hypothetical protein [Synechococcus sp. ATX 2A4]|uniref:hypothetical protein n=1 Tax=Synechococcus sp. ATX 2A4 TaxID=2823727 RepID=UPI0020CCBDFD|nr:hypothetical protein [Synechococcus sp. ATX 2A4]